MRSTHPPRRPKVADGPRTRSLLLGRQLLSLLRYDDRNHFRDITGMTVQLAGVEPATHGLKVRCATSALQLQIS